MNASPESTQSPPAMAHCIASGQFDWATVPLAGPDEFRLIRIDPLQNDGIGLRLTVFCTSLDPCPPSFIVLSYGVPDIEHGYASSTAIINGRLCSIREPIATALRCLAGMSLYVWADHLCINYESSAEMTTHSILMNRILSSCAEVLIWTDFGYFPQHQAAKVALELGIAAEHARLPCVLQQSNDYQYPNAQPGTIQSHHFQCFEVFVRGLKVPSNFGIQAVVQNMTLLLGLRVFHCGWTIQEMVVPARVSIQCGDIRMPFETFCTGVGVLYAYARRIALITDHDLSLEQLAPFEAVVDELRQRITARKMYHDPEMRQKLTYSQLISRFGASGRFFDPRHSVFGFMGVAADAHLFADKISLNDKINDIFTVVAGELFASGDFRILELVQHPKPVSTLPSWVPDFSAFRQPSIDSVTSSGEIKTTPISVAGTPSEDATDVNILGPELPLLHTYVADLDMLKMSGVIIDQVCAVGQAAPNIKPGKPLNVASAIHTLYDIRIFCDYSRVLQRQPDMYQIYDDSTRQAEAYWRIPMFDMKAKQKGPVRKAPDLADGHRFMDAMERASWNYLFVSGQLNIDDVPLSPSEEACYSYLSEDDRHHIFRELRRQKIKWDVKFAQDAAAGVGMHGKRPLLTYKGFVGLGPRQMAKSDIIFVPRGGGVPLVLRPYNLESGACTGMHKIIGEAYIDGLMLGEAWEMGISERLVHIC